MKKFFLLTTSVLLATGAFAQDNTEEPAGPTWTVEINCTEPADYAGVTTYDMTNTGFKNGEFDIYSATVTLEDHQANKAAKYFITLKYVNGEEVTAIKYNNGGSVMIQPNSGNTDITVSGYRNAKGVQSSWSLIMYSITDANRRALAMFPSSKTGGNASLYFNQPLANGEFKGIQNVTKNFDTGYNYISGTGADQFSFTPRQKWAAGIYEATINYERMDFAIEAVSNIDVDIDGFRTFAAPCEVELPEGVKAYTLKFNPDEPAVLDAVKIDGDKLAANTPVVLKAEAGTYTIACTSDVEYTLDTETAPTFIHDVTTEGNVLVGVMQPHFIREGCYAPEGLIFNLWDENDSGDGKGKTVNYNLARPFSAYVSLPEFPEGTEKPEELTVNFPADETEGGDPTGIENVSIEAAAGQTYNLMGMPVDDSFKGLVIRNGKKYIQR